MLNKIILKGLRLYAYHGAMPQERTIGAYFTLDVEMVTHFQAAIESDNLSDTINYATVFSTIKREMATPSQLLEHAAGRIAKALMTEHPTIEAVQLRMLKENPPMGAECQGAGVEITLTKQDLTKT